MASAIKQGSFQPSLSSYQTPLSVRLGCRSGAITGPTAGMAPGYVQGNLAVLPQELANEFLRFCHANPKPCPVIGMSEPGSFKVPTLGEDLDIRTDFPGYLVWKDGKVIADTTDVSEFWRDDLVAFVIGCSHSFEEALLQEGLPLRHIDQGTKVPMFRTSVRCTPVGRFSGRMVMSMRPLTPANAIRAIQITTRFPSVHGAPMHVGLPELIGVADVMKPDFGAPVEVRDDELPVFWACGVTPQSVLMDSKPDFAITHAPGCMLVTDKRNTELAIL
ncbi:putative hydro-lyase [Xanthobacter autotrophicus DSM 431]|uniref:putative hydro-lyase n=1 Tax=Xanthobacter nonsaccharivorans TaxID=3119912 RepID=UPI00372760CA